jgi:threonine dehydrogenase-like Zn-dependent dehydrogenase
MKALRFAGPWQLDFTEVVEPASPVGDEVVVAIKCSTVCGTDLGIIAGLYPAAVPLTLGHEAAGVVHAVGPAVQALKVGDRVAIDPTYYCLQCRSCRNGWPNHCERKVGTETGVSRDGTFAPFYVTQERFLHRLGDDISFAEACFTEPLSCVLTGVNQLQLRSNLTSVVAGGGPIGMLYAFALGLRGVSGVIMEIAPERRRHCERSAPPGWSVLPSLADLPHGGFPNGQFDLAVDTTGLLLGELLPRCQRGGQILLVGLRPAVATVNPAELVDRSISLLGSIDSIGTFAESLALITSGKAPVDALLTETFSLADHRWAFSSLGCDLDLQLLRASSRQMKIAFVIDH